MSSNAPTVADTPVAHTFTPEWARHAIWYQVMPDRFFNGDPSNDPPHTRDWRSEWFSPAEWERAHGDNFYRYVFGRHYGGDLAGLRAKLPYLRDLGVNALYLNPIFQASTHHKYNATNYLHVDEHFGTLGDYAAVVASEDLADPTTWKWTASDRLFLDFLQEAHAAGMRVIIDGVFNHVGTQHPAFQDVRANGHRSRFADWFDVVGWEPFDWHGWAGFKDLPVFRKAPHGLASEGAKAHIFAVTKRWMDPDGDGNPADGIDGWRLDVPNEIAPPFWVDWRRHVRSINPQAYIVGEIWHRADDWLRGQHFDAVMNYPFAHVAVDWVCNRSRKISASAADARLRELRNAYAPEVTAVLQNLLDSHDTARIASIAKNPDRDYERGHRAQDHPGYDHGKPGALEYARVRLCALLQMTYVGAPMVYYGDEVGMWGADDPSNRKPMLWPEMEPYENPRENFVMNDLRAYYKQIIALRKGHAALRTNNIETVLTHDPADVWAFRRWDEREQLLVVLNASEYSRDIAIPRQGHLKSDWKVAFGPADCLTVRPEQLAIRVAPLSGVVLVGK
ncbi:MAG: glycoside hydrolase family 13 protein [Phycisphaerae bacterium]|nr:glycoside hydrolase family 13 protein [Phycisphaerae bacterium]